MSQNEKSTFSKNLKRARKNKGWSQEGAATAIGLNPKRYAKYEEGRAEPPHDILHKICDAYEITDLQAFISDESYFDIKHTQEQIFDRYSSLPVYKRRVVDTLLGLTT